MAKNQITTVDIGTNSVKILQLALTESGLIILNHGMKKYPRQSATEKVSDDTIIDTLKQLIEERGFNTKNIALSIPRHLVTVKSLSGLPSSVTDEELDKMVSIQIEPELPFPIAEAVYSTYNVQKLQDGISLEIVASKRSVIDRYIYLSERAGLKLKTIIPSAFAVYGLVFDQFKDELPGRNIAVVESGAGETDFCVIQHGRLSFSRSFTYGGNNLTQLFEKAYNVPFDEAEAKKLAFASIDEQNTQQWADMFSIQIMQSIRAFSGKESNIDYIWLSGGCSNIPGLPEYLTSKLGIEVQPIPHMPNIRHLPGLDELPPESSITVNLGLGLIGMAGSSRTPTVNVNLMPRDIIEKAKRTRKKILIALVSLIIASIISLATWKVVDWQQSKIALAKSLENKVQTLLNDPETKSAKESLERSILIEQVVKPYVTPLEILREMSEKLPDRQRVALTSLTIDKNGKVTMNVEAMSHNDIGEMIQTLSEIRIYEDVSLFTDVKHGTISKVTKENRPILQVQIICNLNQGESQEVSKDEKTNKS